MSSPIVWFHHNGENTRNVRDFLVALLDLQASDGPAGLTMLATSVGPFAAISSKAARYGDRNEWIPFVAVEDVDTATQRALGLGASLVREKTHGPAGDFPVERDPGGAALALWRKA